MTVLLPLTSKSVCVCVCVCVCDVDLFNIRMISFQPTNKHLPTLVGDE
jgi:hypothetical protein